MTAPELLLLWLYFAVLTCLSVYGLHRCYLVYLYTKHRGSALPRNAVDPAPRSVTVTDARRSDDPGAFPFVTVQLPIYNEMYVVDRLIDAVAALDYPRERFEVQILDDSADDDETGRIARRSVERASARGVHIAYLRRDERAGFKAGALANGLRSARGELIAVFDADFVPHPDFLRRMIPPFDDPGVGMVQARWGHLNRDYSMLTRIQAMFLDAHFVLEHGARHLGGLFFNFNGTAGVWRRAAIESAGGWLHDTLTEDLDLSYRAQLAGWRFVFLPDVVAPAELPVEMNGFKIQQHRWARGSIQTCFKLLPRLLRAEIPLRTKVEAWFHLTANFNYPLLLLLCVVMVPSLFLQAKLGLDALLLVELLLFCAALLSVANFYVLSQRAVRADWVSQLRYLPLLIAVGVGLAVNNTLAVLGARAGGRHDFQRTAKYAVVGLGDDWRSKRYRRSSVAQPLVELAFGLYYTAAVVYAGSTGLFAQLPVLCVFQVGFLYTAVLSLVQQQSGADAPRAQMPALHQPRLVSPLPRSRPHVTTERDTHLVSS